MSKHSLYMGPSRSEGSSFGETLAAARAGCWVADDGIRVARIRGTLRHNVTVEVMAQLNQYNITVI